MLAEDWLTKHFRRSEFACRCGCGFADIDMNLVRKLECIRRAIGRPIRITSGCRCPKYNALVGGKPNSAHLKGLAADVYCPDSEFRYHFLNWALSYFRRIGIGPDFIHVDIDESKPQYVVWLY